MIDPIQVEDDFQKGRRRRPHIRHSFWVSGAILKHLLQFFNEYEELDTLETGDQAEASLRETGEALEEGG